MKLQVKQLLSPVFKILPQRWQNAYYKLAEGVENKNIIKAWEQSGRPTPPPHPVKQAVIAEYKKKFDYQVFIETGTFLGAMVAAQIDQFAKIYSIELGEDLWKRACERFKSNKQVT